MKTLIFLFAAMLATPVSAENYDSLRSDLISNGWEPVQPLQRDTCFDYKIGNCGKYPEAKDCSGTGIAACVMVWKRNGLEKTIYTAGEMPPKVMKVSK